MDVILEVGGYPSPPPTRRQVIDANKGAVCLMCHRMPYPTAPQEPKAPGGETLSSIQITALGGLRLLTASASSVNKIAGIWSPDGSHILFCSWRSGNPEIFTMNADGNDLRQLTDNLAYDVFPCWSPDGKKIAFDSDRMGNVDIWVIDVPQ